MSYPYWKGQLPGTAPQTLSIVGQNLSISDGNTVVIPITTIPGPGDTLQVGTLDASDGVAVGPYAAPTITLDGASGNLTADGTVSANGVNTNTVSATTVNATTVNAVSLVQAPDLSGTNLTITNINGAPAAALAANWAQYAANHTVDLAGNTLYGGAGPTTDLTMTASRYITATADSITLTADQGPALTDYADINLVAQKGNRGRVNITANAGDPDPLTGSSIQGEVHIVANGSSGGAVSSGGLITLDAYTGTPGSYGGATSAIKMSASGINSYAGAVPSVGSVAGYMFNYGTLGINNCVGLPAVLPNFPGTEYHYATGGVGYGGIRFESPAGVEMVNSTDFYPYRMFPYYNSFLVGTHPDMLISGRNNVVGNNQRVVLEKVRNIQFDGDGGATTITGVDTVNGADINYKPTNTFYVSPNGSDATGIGSELRPFQTITGALASPLLTSLPDSAEIAIMCSAGTYTENVVITRTNISLIAPAGTSSSAANLNGTLTWDIATTGQSTIAGSVSNFNLFGTVSVAGNTLTAVSQGAFRIFNCGFLFANDTPAFKTGPQIAASFPLFITMEQCNFDIGSSATPNTTAPGIWLQTGTLTMFDSRFSFNGSTNAVRITEGNFQTRNVNFQNTTASAAPGAIVYYENTNASTSNLLFYSRFQFTNPTTDTGTSKCAIEFNGTGGVLMTAAYVLMAAPGSSTGEIMRAALTSSVSLNYGNLLGTAAASGLSGYIAKTLLPAVEQSTWTPTALSDLNMAGYSILNATNVDLSGTLNLTGLAPKILATDPSPVAITLQATQGVDVLNGAGNHGYLASSTHSIYDSAAPTQFVNVGWDNASQRVITSPGGVGSNSVAYLSDIPAAFRESYDLFVAPNGSDITGTGAASKPYLTIAAAITARAGLGASMVVIHLAAGTYTENPTLAAGTYLAGDAGTADPATDPTTIVGTITSTATNTGLMNLSVSGSVSATGSANVFILNNCTITNTTGFAVSGNAQTTITNCRITSSGTGCANITTNGVYTILDSVFSASVGSCAQATGTLIARNSSFTSTNATTTAPAIIRFVAAATSTANELAFCKVVYTSQTTDVLGQKCCVRFENTATVGATITQCYFDCRGAITASGGNIQCIQHSGAGTTNLLYGGIQAVNPAHNIAPAITKTQMTLVP